MPGPRSPVAALALALAAAAGAVLVPASQPALAGQSDASTPGRPHGTPLGGPFTNWVVKEYPVIPGGTIYTVTIANAGGDWYAVGWIELELVSG